MAKRRWVGWLPVVGTLLMLVPWTRTSIYHSAELMQGDGGGPLEVQARDLGWGGGLSEGSRPQGGYRANIGRGKAVGQKSRWRVGEGSWGEREKRRSMRINAALSGLKRMVGAASAVEDEGDWLPEGSNSARVYSSVHKGLEQGMAFSPAGQVLGRQIENVAGIGQSSSPSILASLAGYIGVAIQEQKALTKAMEKKRRAAVRAPANRHGAGGSLQYGLKLTDEYDGLPQRTVRRFAADDVPKLECPGGGQRVDRLDDCSMGSGKEYNRMFYLDRRLSNKQASRREVRNEFQGVKKLTDEWRHLLVGGGGGSGEPGSFDSPYYFCYSAYQEDPEFSMCLRDLAEKKNKEYQGSIENQRMGYVREPRHESWARGALDPDDSVRVGFPDLRKEWEETLGQNDGGSADNRPQAVP